MWVADTQEWHEDDSTPSGREPIAIIGMGCRFPGSIGSPERYWDFMVAGDEARREVPSDRWAAYAAMSPAHANAVRRAIRFGGYLDDIEGFDADFFGISPKEAEQMDPQQRIALEVAWETLERAGIVPTTLAGSDTGVFLGVCTDDYGRRMLEDLPRLEAWMGIGSSLCGIPNRISYALDLRGPSLAVDTACSASLVAIHQACQSLWLGDTSLALAGGVMLVTSPAFALVLEAAGALSPDGRSKAFDASADGYGRGEGCGMVALKRLSDARRDHDPVLAVIRGSAVCQDGRTNGIMAPSQEAQEHLLREACLNAGVKPSTMDYIEAHGTGTGLGDPIEAGALAAVVGTGRAPDEPCLIGSVKTNIGHLEAASGVAGVIKVVLAMQHGEIPATLSATGLNPDIPWSGSGLRVVHRLTPWPTGTHPRRAGVGNYGYGGTVAHVVLEQAPPVAKAPAPARAKVPVPDRTGPRAFPVSSASAAGVRDNAAALADWLAAHPDAPLDAVGHTLAHRRAALAARTVVVAEDRTQLVERLRQVAADRGAAGVSTGQVVRSGSTPHAVWVFSGHGAQWAGMGAELLADEPLFAETMAELSDLYRAELGFDPRRPATEEDLRDVARAQAMIFATQVALARVWRAYGLRPAAIVGHSVGEVAAAVVAGMLDLPDAARLICHRSRLLRRVAGKGAMAMVGLGFDETVARLSGVVGVEAAITASPSSTVISGALPEVERLARQWSAEGLPVRRVNSDVAFHSPDVDGLVPDLLTGLAGLTAHPPTVPVYSTALDDPRGTTPRDASYWAANLRRPVRFTEAVTAAAADGHRVFLEVSTHPVVQHSIAETLSTLGLDDGAAAHTLRRDRPERATLLENLGVLHCHGVPVDWHTLQPAGDLLPLPATVWQHRRYWLDTPTPVARHQHDVDGHTLLGTRTAVLGTSPVLLWQTYLDEANRPYPGGHAVLGTEVVPAAAVLTTFLDAADGAELTDVSLRVPIGVTTPRSVQVVRQDDSLRLASRLSTQDDDRSWLTHAVAEIAGQPPSPVRLDVPALRLAAGETVPPSAVMDRLRAIGVVGIGFPWQVVELSRGADRLLATVDADPDGTMPVSTWASLLDAAMSVAPLVFPGDPLLRMPGELRAVAVTAAAPGRALVAVRLVEGSPDVVEVDIEVLTADGTVLAVLDGVRFGAVQKEVLADVGVDPAAPADDAEQWRSLSGPDLQERVVAAVREVAAHEIKVAPQELDLHRPLAEAGVDSLMTVSIRLRLERRFRVPVQSTLLWNRPTVAAIAEYLTEELARDAQPAAPAAG